MSRDFKNYLNELPSSQMFYVLPRTLVNTIFCLLLLLLGTEKVIHLYFYLKLDTMHRFSMPLINYILYLLF